MENRNGLAVLGEVTRATGTPNVTPRWTCSIATARDAGSRWRG